MIQSLTAWDCNGLIALSLNPQKIDLLVYPGPAYFEEAYVVSPITAKKVVRRFSSDVMPSAAKKNSKRSTYCGQSSTAGWNSPILPNVAILIARCNNRND